MIQSESQVDNRQSLASQGSQLTTPLSQNNQNDNEEILRYVHDIKNTKISDFMQDTYMQTKNSNISTNNYQPNILQNVSFVLRRRLYASEMIKNFEQFIEQDQEDSNQIPQPKKIHNQKVNTLSNHEIKLLFNQLSYFNIIHHDYNEETIAIKQAALLESVRLIESQGIKDIHSAQLDIREINTIFPQQLVTYFNKKSIYKKIQQTKQYLQYNIKVEQLEQLYLKLCFQQQPQIGSCYFSVQVLGLTDQELYKQLKKIEKSSLLLVVSPLSIGFAEDFGKNGGCNKNHKKLKAMIMYDQIEEIDIQQPNMIQQNLISNKSKDLKNQFQGAFKITYSSRSYIQSQNLSPSLLSRKSVEAQNKVQSQNYNSQQSQGQGEHQIILKSLDISPQNASQQNNLNNGSSSWHQQEEIIHLINDYLNYKYRDQPLKPSDYRNQRQKLQKLNIYIKLEYDILRNFKEYQVIHIVHSEIQEYIEQQDFRLLDALDLEKQKYVALSQIALKNLADQNELKYVTRIQRWIKNLKYVQYRKSLIRNIKKIQAYIKGFIVRYRIRKSYKQLRMYCFYVLILIQFFQIQIIKKYINIME